MQRKHTGHLHPSYWSCSFGIFSPQHPACGVRGGVGCGLGHIVTIRGKTHGGCTMNVPPKLILNRIPSNPVFLKVMCKMSNQLRKCIEMCDRTRIHEIWVKDNILFCNNPLIRAELWVARCAAILDFPIYNSPGIYVAIGHCKFIMCVSEQLVGKVTSTVVRRLCTG